MRRKYDGYDSAQVVDFLLRDPDNPSSVLSVIKSARDNARLVRTALTTEVWSAVNETWMLFTDLLVATGSGNRIAGRSGDHPAAIRAGAGRAARHDAAQ